LAACTVVSRIFCGRGGNLDTLSPSSRQVRQVDGVVCGLGEVSDNSQPVFFLWILGLPSDLDLELRSSTNLNWSSYLAGVQDVASADSLREIVPQ
jgi:hypothetical protein